MYSGAQKTGTTFPFTWTYTQIYRYIQMQYLQGLILRGPANCWTDCWTKRGLVLVYTVEVLVLWFHGVDLRVDGFLFNFCEHVNFKSRSYNFVNEAPDLVLAWFWSYCFMAMILESMVSCFPFISWTSFRILFTSSAEIFTSSWRTEDTWTNNSAERWLPWRLGQTVRCRGRHGSSEAVGLQGYGVFVRVCICSRCIHLWLSFNSTAG